VGSDKLATGGVWSRLAGSSRVVGRVVGGVVAGSVLVRSAVRRSEIASLKAVCSCAEMGFLVAGGS